MAIVYKNNLKEIRAMFERDTLTRKANKSANAPILKLIKIINNDNAVIECEGNSAALPNRGSVVECLIKLIFVGGDYARKTFNDNEPDMVVKGKAYEIKYSSSKGYAYYQPNANLERLIFVDGSGVYLTSGKNIILDKCGKHIQSIVMDKNVKVLAKF